MSGAGASRAHLVPEILERPLQSLIYGDTGVPAENPSCQGEVRTSHPRIVLRKGLVHNAQIFSREGEDFFGEIIDGQFLRVSEVDRAMTVRHQEAVNALHKVGDIAEASGLGSVTVHREILAPEGLHDK